MYHFGADPGRGEVKVYSGSGESIKFTSYVAPARELDLVSDGNVMDRLTVSINGEDYFIGELARREGGSREFQKLKHDHRNTLPLLLTGIALAAQTEHLAPKVVMGLPISDYRTQARAYEAAVLGYYNVALPHKRVGLEICRGQVVCFPEGAGAAYDLLLNDQGRSVQTDLATKTFAVLDIGWKTANVVVLKDCLYQDALSTTFQLGLSTAFRPYYKRLSRERDIAPSAAEVRMIKDAGPELQRLAQQIQDRLDQWWNAADIDDIYLAGGGGAALSPYLGWKLIRDPQLANARGFYKVARSRLV